MPSHLPYREGVPDWENSRRPGSLSQLLILDKTPDANRLEEELSPLAHGFKHFA